MDDKPFSRLKNDLFEYVENRISLIKLDLYEKVAQVAASSTYTLIMVFLAFTFFFFLAVAGGFWLSEVFKSYLYGFGSIAGIFLFVLLLFVLFKRGFKNSVSNGVIKGMMSEKKKKDDE